MSSFLLFISFVLNGIAFLAIINLYLRQNRLFQVERQVEQSLEEMESIISSYLFEMKEENEQFINRLKNVSKENQYKEKENVNDNLNVDNNLIIKKESINNDEPSIPRIEHTSRLQALNSYKKSNVVTQTKSKINNDFANNNNESDLKTEQYKTNSSSFNSDEVHNEDLGDTFEQLQSLATKEISLYEQINELKQQNYSTEEIAKKLNKGKTEVELILKLHQN